MKVIGAGFGRTGTLSLRIALSRLLNGPCYHMANIVQDPTQLEHWHAWAQHPHNSPNWEAILSGYQAGVDAPICFFVEELMQRYPEAKVVLTIRDPEKWVASFQNLIRANISCAWMGLFSRRIRRFVTVGRALGQRFVGKIDRAALLQAYERHNEKIKSIVPPSRLLVMRVEDGWAPLCAFLNRPIPRAPFPHENEGTARIRKSHWDMALGRHERYSRGNSLIFQRT